MGAWMFHGPPGAVAFGCYRLSLGLFEGATLSGDTRLVSLSPKAPNSQTLRP